MTTMRQTMTKFFFSLIIIFLFSFKCLCQNEGDKKISTLFYELNRQDLDNQRLAKISEMLKSNSPDIAVLAGIKNLEELKKIKSAVITYDHISFDENDKEDLLVFFSKIKPENLSYVKGEYKIRNDKKNSEDTLETKSFIVAKFAVQNYVFYVISGKVKDQTPHSEYNQFDMRRYEIRQLRYVFDKIQKADPEANILILANLNDSCEMSTVKEIYARKYGYKKRVFDIRPIDKLKTTWTYWEQNSDEYIRSSYALMSYNMLPELIRDNTKIVLRDDWLSISPHRPIYISFIASEMQEYSDKYLAAIYENSIYSEIAAHFEKDKIIGEKPKRKSPETEKKKKK